MDPPFSSCGPRPTRVFATGPARATVTRHALPPLLATVVTRHALPLLLATVACGGASTTIESASPPARIGPDLGAAQAPLSPAAQAPPTTSPGAAVAREPWHVLESYLPALRGLDHDAERLRVAGYAASPDDDAVWRQLAADLAAGEGTLAHTCAGDVSHVIALVVDDPRTTSSIGRPAPEIRVFWMPLASVADMTVAQAIRAAGLVDGPDAQTVARHLRRSQGPDGWIPALEASEVWFLPAGDDPTMHHRRIRGYAVAPAAVLQRDLTYVGTNAVGGFCELATRAIALPAPIATGPIHGGASSPHISSSN